MKKIFLIIVILLVSVFTYGQGKEYTNWAVDVELGNSTVNDESAVSDETYNGFSHIGAGVRYNINPKFGIGLRGGYDNVGLLDIDNKKVELDYGRVTIDFNVDVLKVLDVYSNWFTLHVHGGPGVGFINTDNNYDETVAVATGGVTGLFRIKNRSAIRLDFSTTANIAQNRTLDGSFPTGNDGISSTIHNVSIGYVLYFGKNEKVDGKLKRHADWSPQKSNEILQPITNVTNVYPVSYVTNEITKTCECECINVEYVFFDHDKFNIKDTELNAIYKVYTLLQNDDSLSLVIKGWASPTDSSDEYNLKLSENRSNEVYDKYIDMGINPERIEFDFYGKDHEYEKQNVHDVARRVELIVIKK